jgi:hypothetical protein
MPVPAPIASSAGDSSPAGGWPSRARTNEAAVRAMTGRPARSAMSAAAATTSTSRSAAALATTTVRGAVAMSAAMTASGPPARIVARGSEVTGRSSPVRSRVQSTRFEWR